MADINSLSVKLNLDLSGFQKQCKQARDMLDNAFKGSNLIPKSVTNDTQRELGKINSSFKDLGKVADDTGNKISKSFDNVFKNNNTAQQIDNIKQKISELTTFIGVQNSKIANLNKQIANGGAQSNLVKQLELEQATLTKAQSRLREYTGQLALLRNGNQATGVMSNIFNNQLSVLSGGALNTSRNTDTLTNSTNVFRQAQENAVSSINRVSEALRQQQIAMQNASATTANPNVFNNMSNMSNNVASRLNNSARNTSSLNSALNMGRQATIFKQVAASLDSVGKSYDRVKNKIKGFIDRVNQTTAPINNFVRNMFSVRNSNNSAEKSFKSLGTTISTVMAKLGIVFGVYQLLRFGKACLDAGSDLAEVQNVVDVTFGDMASNIDDFANKSMKAFGLSTLQAKKFAGTMGAMLKSSGITGGALEEMSKTIVGLTGDMASFYNINQEEAFTKIRAGLAGEIMPLRELGVNMSVANLEAYALANGINKAYSEMSQAEQVMLRYNYLLAVTGDAQGDFART